MFPTSRATLALAFALTAGGCGEDPFAPDLAPEGEARFTYSGERTGEFVGAGRLNRRNPNAGTWAVGEHQTVGGTQVLAVISQQGQPELKVDYLLIEWAGAQAGSVTCNASTVSCPFDGVFIVKADRFSNVSEATYTNPTGTLTVTELGSNR
ncbi:MAG TPA: hypothetical protein VGX50_09045, partial [Longimicrobium sp.]|nr:hypothetical protein [Longimicrobium sp.]